MRCCKSKFSQFVLRNEPVKFRVNQRGCSAVTKVFQMVTAEEELPKTDISLKDNELSLKFFALQFFEQVSHCSSVQQHFVAYTFVRSFVLYLVFCSLFIYLIVSFYHSVYIIYTQSDLRLYKQIYTCKVILVQTIWASKCCG